MVPNDTEADQCTRCRPWHGAAPGGWGRRDGVPVWLIPLTVDHGIGRAMPPPVVDRG